MLTIPFQVFEDFGSKPFQTPAITKFFNEACSGNHEELES